MSRLPIAAQLGAGELQRTAGVAHGLEHLNGRAPGDSAGGHEAARVDEATALELHGAEISSEVVFGF